MIALLQESLAKLPPKSRGRQIVTDLLKQEKTKQLRDELPFLCLERDICAILDAEMDQSDGLTPDMVLAEIPEFADDDFMATMGLLI